MSEATSEMSPLPRFDSAFASAPRFRAGSERQAYLILEFQANQWFNRRITDDAPYR